MANPEIRMSVSGEVVQRWEGGGWQFVGGTQDGEPVEDGRVEDWAVLVPFTEVVTEEIFESVAVVAGIAVTVVEVKDMLDTLKECVAALDEGDAVVWEPAMRTRMTRNVLDMLTDVRRVANAIETALLP